MYKSEDLAINLRSSINGLRNFGILAAILLSFKQPALAFEAPADSDGGGSKVELNAEQKSYENEASAAEQREKTEIERLSKRVAELNAKSDRDGKRRAELQEAVDKGAPGSAQAISELQTLRNSPAIKERDDYIRELKAKQAEISKNLAATKAKLEKLKSRRTSWSSSQSDLDAEERKLVGWMASLSSAERINKIVLSRLESGATTFSEGPMSNETLQERFFPTR